jgi:hypothetical protein
MHDYMVGKGRISEGDDESSKAPHHQKKPSREEQDVQRARSKKRHGDDMATATPSAPT